MSVLSSALTRCRAELWRLHEQPLHDLFQFPDREFPRVVEVLFVTSTIPSSETVLPHIARAGADFAEILRPGDSVKNRRRIGAVALPPCRAPYTRTRYFPGGTRM